MATQTPNISLVKPSGTENYDLDVWNANSDIIDTEITDAKAGSNLRIFKCKNDTSSNDNALNVQAGDGRYYKKIETYSQAEADVITDAIEEKVDNNTAHIFGINVLINGNKRINQRAYSDGVLGDGDYGYDRWAGANSDVNIKQIVESSNIKAGNYTISWVGGGTATVGVEAGLSSGDTVTVPSGNLDVIVPKGATEIQLERGSRKTPFEQRFIGLELSLCHRFYWSYEENSVWEMIATCVEGPTATKSHGVISLPVCMRITPDVTYSGIRAVDATQTTKTIDSVDGKNKSSIGIVVSSSTSAVITGNGTNIVITADAEL